MSKHTSRIPRPPRTKRKIPRSFKDLTPSRAFNPSTFFREMVWKAFLTPRVGDHKKPDFPKLTHGQVARERVDARLCCVHPERRHGERDEDAAGEDDRDHGAVQDAAGYGPGRVLRVRQRIEVDDVRAHRRGDMHQPGVIPNE